MHFQWRQLDTKPQRFDKVSAKRRHLSFSLPAFASIAYNCACFESNGRKETRFNFVFFALTLAFFAVKISSAAIFRIPSKAVYYNNASTAIFAAMAKLPFDIVFENEQLIAVNKPSGMLTLPDRHDMELQSLRGILQAHFGQIFVVHRLDKDTSGLIVFAKNEVTHKYMSQLFENREVEKMYLGLVLGTPAPLQGSIIEPIGEHPAKDGTMTIYKKGKPSHTDYKTLETLGKYSLVEFDLKTGRTHQIRVHCKHIGHPIVCDPFYGDGKPVLISSLKKKYNLSKSEEEEKPILGRLALHAFRLSFTDENGQALVLEAPLHKDMRALMQQLKKNL